MKRTFNEKIAYFHWQTIIPTIRSIYSDIFEFLRHVVFHRIKFFTILINSKDVIIAYRFNSRTIHSPFVKNDLFSYQYPITEDRICNVCLSTLSSGIILSTCCPPSLSSIVILKNGPVAGEINFTSMDIRYSFVKGCLSVVNRLLFVTSNSVFLLYNTDVSLPKM